MNSFRIKAALAAGASALVLTATAAYAQAPAAAPTAAQTARAAAQAAQAARMAEAAAKPTPRTADGHPDFTGIWRGISGPAPSAANDVRAADGSINVVTGEYGSGGRRAMPADGPKYKTEFVAKVDYNDINQPIADKVFNCGRAGVPRMGAPHQISQTKDMVVLMYSDVAGETFRAIPTDGRAPRDFVDPSYNGEAVAHWEGDTLVIKSNNFVDETWIGERGYLHSDKMEVTERLTRKGDTLTWGFTVHDPEVLTADWSPPPRTVMRYNELLEESQPCVDIALPNLVNMDNHGQR